MKKKITLRAVFIDCSWLSDWLTDYPCFEFWGFYNQMILFCVWDCFCFFYLSQTCFDRQKSLLFIITLQLFLSDSFLGRNYRFQRVFGIVEVRHGLAELLPRVRSRQLWPHRLQRAQASTHDFWIPTVGRHHRIVSEEVWQTGWVLRLKTVLIFEVMSNYIWMYWNKAIAINRVLSLNKMWKLSNSEKM